MTLDATYDYSPLNPDTNAPQGCRFWGWTKAEDINWSGCGPDGLQYATVIHYVFWKVNDTKVITRPCP